MKMSLKLVIGQSKQPKRTKQKGSNRPGWSLSFIFPDEHTLGTQEKLRDFKLHIHALRMKKALPKPAGPFLINLLEFQEKVFISSM